MSRWRVVMTDTEGPTGIAPECPKVASHDKVNGKIDESGVYDCCPFPQLEFWNEGIASTAAKAFNSCDVKVCD